MLIAHELQKCIEPMASSSSPPPTKEGSLLDIFSHASNDVGSWKRVDWRSLFGRAALSKMKQSIQKKHKLRDEFSALSSALGPILYASDSELGVLGVMEKSHAEWQSLIEDKLRACLNISQSGGEKFQEDVVLVMTKLCGTIAYFHRHQGGDSRVPSHISLETLHGRSAVDPALQFGIEGGLSLLLGIVEALDTQHPALATTVFSVLEEQLAKLPMLSLSQDSKTLENKALWDSVSDKLSTFCDRTFNAATAESRLQSSAFRSLFKLGLSRGSLLMMLSSAQLLVDRLLRSDMSMSFGDLNLSAILSASKARIDSENQLRAPNMQLLDQTLILQGMDALNVSDVLCTASEGSSLYVLHKTQGLLHFAVSSDSCVLEGKVDHLTPKSTFSSMAAVRGWLFICDGSTINVYDCSDLGSHQPVASHSKKSLFAGVLKLPSTFSEQEGWEGSLCSVASDGGHLVVVQSWSPCAGGSAVAAEEAGEDEDVVGAEEGEQASVSDELLAEVHEAIMAGEGVEEFEAQELAAAMMENEELGEASGILELEPAGSFAVDVDLDHAELPGDEAQQELEGGEEASSGEDSPADEDIVARAFFATTLEAEPTLSSVLQVVQLRGTSASASMTQAALLSTETISDCRFDLENPAVSISEAVTVEVWTMPFRPFEKGSVVFQFGNFMVTIGTSAIIIGGSGSMQYDPKKSRKILMPVPGNEREWVHVACSLDQRKTARVYVNGELVDTVLDCGVNLDPKFVKISSCEGILLSELRIWNVARSAEDIRSNFRKNVAPSHSSLVHCFPMREGFGNYVHDQVTMKPSTNFGRVSWHQVQHPFEHADSTPYELSPLSASLFGSKGSLERHSVYSDGKSLMIVALASPSIVQFGGTNCWCFDLKSGLMNQTYSTLLPGAHVTFSSESSKLIALTSEGFQSFWNNSLSLDQQSDFADLYQRNESALFTNKDSSMEDVLFGVFRLVELFACAHNFHMQAETFPSSQDWFSPFCLELSSSTFPCLARLLRDLRALSNQENVTAGVAELSQYGLYVGLTVLAQNIRQARVAEVNPRHLHLDDIVSSFVGSVGSEEDSVKDVLLNVCLELCDGEECPARNVATKAIAEGVDLFFSSVAEQLNLFLKILGLDAITGANLFLFNSLLSKYSNFETLVKVHSLLEGPEFSSENTFDVLKRLLSSAVTQSDERIRMSLLQMLASFQTVALTTTTMEKDEDSSSSSSSSEKRDRAVVLAHSYMHQVFDVAIQRAQELIDCPHPVAAIKEEGKGGVLSIVVRSLLGCMSSISSSPWQFVAFVDTLVKLLATLDGALLRVSSGSNMQSSIQLGNPQSFDFEWLFLLERQISCLVGAILYDAVAGEDLSGKEEELQKWLSSPLLQHGVDESGGSTEELYASLEEAAAVLSATSPFGASASISSRRVEQLEFLKDIINDTGVGHNLIAALKQQHPKSLSPLGQSNEYVERVVRHVFAVLLKHNSFVSDAMTFACNSDAVGAIPGTLAQSWLGACKIQSWITRRRQELRASLSDEEMASTDHYDLLCTQLEERSAFLLNFQPQPLRVMRAAVPPTPSPSEGSRRIEAVARWKTLMTAFRTTRQIWKLYQDSMQKGRSSDPFEELNGQVVDFLTASDLDLGDLNEVLDIRRRRAASRADALEQLIRIFDMVSLSSCKADLLSCLPRVFGAVLDEVGDYESDRQHRHLLHNLEGCGGALNTRIRNAFMNLLCRVGDLIQQPETDSASLLSLLRPINFVFRCADDIELMESDLLSSVLHSLMNFLDASSLSELTPRSLAFAACKTFVEKIGFHLVRETTEETPLSERRSAGADKYFFDTLFDTLQELLKLLVQDESGGYSTKKAGALSVLESLIQLCLTCDKTENAFTPLVSTRWAELAFDLADLAQFPSVQRCGLLLVQRVYSQSSAVQATEVTSHPKFSSASLLRSFSKCQASSAASLCVDSLSSQGASISNAALWQAVIQGGANLSDTVQTSVELVQKASSKLESSTVVEEGEISETLVDAIGAVSWMQDTPHVSPLGRIPLKDKKGNQVILLGDSEKSGKISVALMEKGSVLQCEMPCHELMLQETPLSSKVMQAAADSPKIVELLALLIRQTCGDVAVDEPPLRVRSKVEKAKILSRHLLQSVLFSRTAKSLASLAREESIADVLASNRELLRSLMFVGGRDIHFGGVSHPLALEEARACAQVVIAELFEEMKDPTLRCSFQTSPRAPTYGFCVPQGKSGGIVFPDDFKLPRLFAVEFWFKLRSRPESGQQQLLFYAGKQAPFSESSERFHIAVAGDNICCGRWYGTWNAGPSDYTTPAVNTWTHLCVSFDGNILHFYKNGVQVSTYWESNPMPSNTNPMEFRFGSGAGGSRSLDGEMFGCRMWNNHLDVEKVKENMYSILPMDTDELYFQLEMKPSTPLIFNSPDGPLTFSLDGDGCIEKISPPNKNAGGLSPNVGRCQFVNPSRLKQDIHVGMSCVSAPLKSDVIDFGCVEVIPIRTESSSSGQLALSPLSPPLEFLFLSRERVPFFRPHSGWKLSEISTFVQSLKEAGAELAFLLGEDTESAVSTTLSLPVFVISSDAAPVSTFEMLFSDASKSNDFFSTTDTIPRPFALKIIAEEEEEEEERKAKAAAVAAASSSEVVAEEGGEEGVASPLEVEPPPDQSAEAGMEFEAEEEAAALSTPPVSPGTDWNAVDWGASDDGGEPRLEGMVEENEHFGEEDSVETGKDILEGLEGEEPLDSGDPAAASSSSNAQDSNVQAGKQQRALFFSEDSEAVLEAVEMIKAPGFRRMKLLKYYRSFQLMDLLMECINLELVLGNFYTRTALLSILSNVPDLEGFQRVTEQISSEFSALEEPFVVGMEGNGVKREIIPRGPFCVDTLVRASLWIPSSSPDSKKNKKMVDLVGKHIQEKIVSGDDSVRDYWGNALRSSAEDIVSNLEGAVTKVSSRTVESKHTYDYNTMLEGVLDFSSSFASCILVEFSPHCSLSENGDSFSMWLSRDTKSPPQYKFTGTKFPRSLLLPTSCVAWKFCGQSGWYWGFKLTARPMSALSLEKSLRKIPNLGFLVFCMDCFSSETLEDPKVMSLFQNGALFSTLVDCCWAQRPEDPPRLGKIFVFLREILLVWNAQVACGATTAVPPKKAMSKLKEALRVAQVTQNTLSRDVQWLLETIVTFEELLLAVKKANPAIDEGGAGASSSSSSPLPALSPDERKQLLSLGPVRDMVAVTSHLSCKSGNLVTLNSTTYNGPGTARSLTGVTGGRWYFEVYSSKWKNVIIGWVDSKFFIDCSTDNIPPPIGSCSHSWAYSPRTKSRLHSLAEGENIGNKSSPYGREFSLSSGDVLGCGLDFDAKEIQFWVNGVPMDESAAFSDIVFEGPLYPAISMSDFEERAKAAYNFGDSPSEFLPQGYRFFYSSGNLVPPVMGHGVISRGVHLKMLHRATRGEATEDTSLLMREAALELADEDSVPELKLRCTSVLGSGGYNLNFADVDGDNDAYSNSSSNSAFVFSNIGSEGSAEESASFVVKSVMVRSRASYQIVGSYVLFALDCEDPQLAFDHVSVFNNCTDTTEFEEMKKGFEGMGICEPLCFVNCEHSNLTTLTFPKPVRMRHLIVFVVNNVKNSNSYGQNCINCCRFWGYQGNDPCAADVSFPGKEPPAVQSRASEQLQQALDILHSGCWTRNEWTAAHDVQLTSLVNALELSGRDAMTMEPSRSLLVRYPLIMDVPVVDLAVRVGLLSLYESWGVSLMPFVDSEYSGQDTVCSALRECKGLISLSKKKRQLYSHLEESCGGSGGVPIRVFRMKAAKSVNDPETDPARLLTLTGQIMTELKDKPESVFQIPLGGRAWSVEFVGEGSTDAGGPYNESITQMCEELMSSALPLFIRCPNGRGDVGINRDKFVVNPGCPLSKFERFYFFVGQLMGLAIRSNNSMALNLSEFTWKQIIGETPTVDDLAAVDIGFVSCNNELKKVTQDMSESSFRDCFMTPKYTFMRSDSVEDEIVPGGSSKEVTPAEAVRFAQLREEARIHEADEQVAAIRKGLHSVIPLKDLVWFSALDVEKLVCGNPLLDLGKLKASLQASSGYTNESPEIKMLFDILESFDATERSLFLKFVWGRSRLPSETSFTFQVTRFHGSNDCLPVSHTCFFSLEWPSYSSIEVATEKLRYAIHHCTAIDTDFGADAAAWAEID
mgnify:CR=1 FL=1